MKNYVDESKTQKKINVKKIVSLNDVINKPIDDLILNISDNLDLKKISDLSKNDAKTKITFQINENNKTYTFILNDKRKVDNEIINQLKLRENIIIR